MTPRIPVMEDMVDPSLPINQKHHEMESKIQPVHGGQTDDQSTSIVDEKSDEDEDYQDPEANIEVRYLQNMINLPHTLYIFSHFIISLYQY
jgi:hypothetical protein